MLHDLQLHHDDASTLEFCGTCAFSAACLAHGYDKSALGALHVLVEHVGPVAEGEHLFREGDPFNAIAAVRSGVVKTYVVDHEGREQVLGFHLPGEIIGLNAIHSSRFPCNAIALNEVQLCRFSFPQMAVLATRMPGLQQQLFRLLSEDIGKAAALAGDFTADERVAAFFVGLAQRSARHGGSATELQLPMTRGDIANHLRLAPETISRVLRRFRVAGLLAIDLRSVRISDPPGLAQLARAVLRNPA